MQWLQKIAKNNRYHSVINRGYYMATRRYKISLRVLNNISQVSTVNEWNILNKLIPVISVKDLCKIFY